MLSYLITDPKYYSNFKSTLEKSIEKYNPDYICFRDKISIKDAKLAIQIAHYYDKVIFVNGYVELLRLGFDGIHFTSNQLHLIDNYTQTLTFASTHNKQEVKQSINADFITFSPIFYSKGREGLGVDIVNEIKPLTKSKIFALGGIVGDEEVKKIEKSKFDGFASIRYFLN